MWTSVSPQVSTGGEGERKRKIREKKKGKAKGKEKRKEREQEREVKLHHTRTQWHTTHTNAHKRTQHTQTHTAHTNAHAHTCICTCICQCKCLCICICLWSAWNSYMLQKKKHCRRSQPSNNIYNYPQHRTAQRVTARCSVIHTSFSLLSSLFSPLLSHTLLSSVLRQKKDEINSDRKIINGHFPGIRVSFAGSCLFWPELGGRKKQNAGW